MNPYTDANNKKDEKSIVNLVSKSEDYEREIEHTREEINETPHSLENKHSPRELRNGLKDFSGNFGRTLRDNPVPADLYAYSSRDIRLILSLSKAYWMRGLNLSKNHSQKKTWQLRSGWR